MFLDYFPSPLSNYIFKHFNIVILFSCVAIYTVLVILRTADIYQPSYGWTKFESLNTLERELRETYVRSVFVEGRPPNFAREYSLTAVHKYNFP